MSHGKTRWDLYAWVGCGEIKLRESNLSLKDAQKAKEKWVAKSHKHEAFIASHADKSLVKEILKGKGKGKGKTKDRAKGKAKSKKSHH